MYPWTEPLSVLTNWAQERQLEIDALGLVTFLGSEEVNACVGRLAQSRYLEFLPLLGAFVVAGDLFTAKQPGYHIYNLSAGITTTELAGWLSRWLKAQQFEQTRSRIRWSANTRRPSRALSFWIPSLFIGIALNGMLTVLAVLSEDWFGFATAVSMIVSVVVRHILVQQNRAGIDRLIRNARKNGRPGSRAMATSIIILDDSKTITFECPGYLMGGVFTRQPDIPNPRLYAFTRWCGWVAFAVHVLSLGMADLHTQICTVVLLILATIITNFKFGCEDYNVSKLRDDRHDDGQDQRSCWISSLLKATVSVYPKSWASWPRNLKHDARYQISNKELRGIDAVQHGMEKLLYGLDTCIDAASDPLSNGLLPVQEGLMQLKQGLLSMKISKLLDNNPPAALDPKEEHLLEDEADEPTQSRWEIVSWLANRRHTDEEARPTLNSDFIKSEGRQDLYVWLNLNETQWNLLCTWNLVPHAQAWQDEYQRKRLYHASRLKMVSS